MLDRSKMIGGFKNGEYSVATGETYFGGSPAYMGADGYLHLSILDTGSTAYCGVFANSKLVDYGRDSTGSPHPATVYYGPFACRLTSGTRDGYADGVPYATGDAWAPGSPLYVGTDGKWTLTAPSGGKKRGHVMVVGATYLDVWLNGAGS